MSDERGTEGRPGLRDGDSQGQGAAGANVRGADERLALSLHRYRVWLETLASKQAEVTKIAADLDATVSYLNYVYLEAREEQEKLIDAGLSQKQIESLGPLTPPSFDPLALLKRVRAVGG